MATQLVEASQLIASQEGTMQLRQIQALLEMSKEESSTIIIYPMDSLGGEMIAAATAGSLVQSKTHPVAETVPAPAPAPISVPKK